MRRLERETLQRVERKIDALTSAIASVTKTETSEMTKLDDINAKQAAFKDSLAKLETSVANVKAAVETLKNAPAGDPDATAAADAALAAFDEDKARVDAQSTDLASVAVQAVHSAGM